MGLPPFSSSTPAATLAIPGKARLTSYNVRDYSVVADGVTDDTAAINAVLSTYRGKKIVIPDGSYLISSPLVIYSGTALYVSRNATITLAPSSNCNLLVDSAHYAGTLTVPSPVNNIYVTGGIWDRGSGNADTSTNGAHNIILGGVGVVVEDVQLKSASGKYGLLLQNIRDFYVNNVFCDNLYSDGVHIQGQAIRGTVRNVRGYSIDDMVSITPIDYAQYVWNNEGDVTDILIDGVQTNNRILASFVKILGGYVNSAPLNTKRITVKNVSGTSGSGIMSVVYIGDDAGDPRTSGGQIDDITIDGVDVPVDSSTPIIYMPRSATSLLIPKVTLRNINVSSNVSAVLRLKHKIGTLILDDIKGATTSAAMNGLVWLDTVSAAQVDRIIASNISLTQAVAGGSLINASVAGQTVPEVLLNNVYLNSFSYLASLNMTTTIRSNNLHAVSNTGMINAGASALVTVYNNPSTSLDVTTNTITAGGAVNVQPLVSTGDPIGAATAMTGGAYLGISGTTGKLVLVGDSAGLIDVNLTSTNPQTGYRGRLFYSTASDYWMFGVNNNERMRLTAIGLGVGNTATAGVDTPASTTTNAGLRIRTGVAPTSPNDGDIWQDGTNLKIRINGVTKTVTLT